jgi:hypothetical protein
VTTAAAVESRDIPGGTGITRQSPATSVPGDDRTVRVRRIEATCRRGRLLPVTDGGDEARRHENTERLRAAFPGVWDELKARYQAPGGVIEGDPDFEEYLPWRAQTLAPAAP